MADTRLVAGSVGRGEGGEGGERGERGHRGPRGHRGRDANAVPTAAFSLSTTTIYARPNGSDKHGDGSFDKPFATFQQAIRFVPNILPPGATFIVDITGIGVETLPMDYEFPVIQGGGLVGDNPTFNGPSPFEFTPNFTLRAQPQLVSSLSPADATITAGIIGVDPRTGLVNITVPLPVWTPGALKGSAIISNIAGQNRSASIYDNTATQLFICKRTNQFGPVGPIVFAPGEVLQIVEPSATLEAPPPTNADNAAIRIGNISSLGLDGIRFRCTVPDTAPALLIANALQPFTELCDIDGIVGSGATYQLSLLRTTLRTVIDVEGSAFTPRDSYWTGIGSGSSGFLDFQGPLFVARTTVFDTCVTLESEDFAGGFIPTPGWAFQNCLLTNSQGDAVHCKGGAYAFTNVAIDGATGNAILADVGMSYITAANLSGVGNAGTGIVADDGTHVVVDAATTIANDTLSAYSNGGVPVATWPGVPFNDTNLTSLSRVSEP